MGLARIKTYFSDRGVSVRDVPKAIVTHELLSIGFLVVTWCAAYHLQPSQNALFAPLNRAIEGSAWRPVVSARQGYRTALVAAEQQLAKSRFLAQKDTARLAASCAEASAFRQLLKPVTIPGKLFLAVKITTFLSRGGVQPLTETAAVPQQTAPRRGGGKRRMAAAALLAKRGRLRSG